MNISIENPGYTTYQPAKPPWGQKMCWKMLKHRSISIYIYIYIPKYRFIDPTVGALLGAFPSRHQDDSTQSWPAGCGHSTQHQNGKPHRIGWTIETRAPYRSWLKPRFLVVFPLNQFIESSVWTWHILWHSICNSLWHSMWHLFWHSVVRSSLHIPDFPGGQTKEIKETPWTFPCHIAHEIPC